MYRSLSGERIYQRPMSLVLVNKLIFKTEQLAWGNAYPKVTTALSIGSVAKYPSLHEAPNKTKPDFINKSIKKPLTTHTIELSFTKAVIIKLVFQNIKYRKSSFISNESRNCIWANQTFIQCTLSMKVKSETTRGNYCENLYEHKYLYQCQHRLTHTKRSILL